MLHLCLTPLLQQQPMHEYLSSLRWTGRTTQLLAYLHHHTVVELEEARRVVIDIRHTDTHSHVTELRRVAVVCGSDGQGVAGDLEGLECMITWRNGGFFTLMCDSDAAC